MNIKKWISNGITVILAICLLVMLFAVITTKASGGQPNFFGYEFRSVLSGSMEPAFKTGSVIVTKPVEDVSTVKENDVITFLEDSETIVTHRVIEVVGNGDQLMFQTKGDNNDAIDANLVLSANVIGQYTGVNVPYLGYFMEFTKTNKGTAILLIIPGILLLIYSGITIWQTVRVLDKEMKKIDTQDAESSV